jgi:two-component system nitrogen regulation response regulator GlnG/two-component system response regulator HydG
LSAPQTTQLDVARTKQPRGADQPSPALALVLVASRSEPGRIGELWLPPAGGQAGLFGRLDPNDAKGHLGWVRQRPGRNLPTGPLTAPGISRAQLRVATLPGDALLVENVGRRALLVDGQPVTQATVRAGTTLELLSEALLLVTERPRTMAPPRWLEPATIDAVPFGQADAHGMVGEAPSVWALRERLAFAARDRGHVLVCGASGSGKELVARALHDGAGPWVARNAATLPESLIDAELFGNARNFPNPGMKPRAGLIGAADGGTLFLDEIAELPLDQQPHLLRVLDADGEYQQLGDDRVRRSSFRLVGATNRPLDAMRTDFAARFEHRIELPPLQQRAEDIPLIARQLAVERATQSAERWARFVSPEGALAMSFEWLRTLLARPPADNVRGLTRALLESLRHSEGDRLVAPPTGTPRRAAEPDATPAHPTPDWQPPTREAIQACLDKHNGVQGPVWRELGFKNRYQLQRLIRKHGLRTAVSAQEDDDA